MARLRVPPLPRLLGALALLVVLACLSPMATSANSTASSSTTPTLRRATLATWRFRSLNGSVSVANVSTPGTVHTHLLAAGVLTEDPYYRFNEMEMQWVARTTWVYETTLPDALVASGADGDARVVFESLEGVAHVALNGQSLGAPAVNAFRPHAFALPRAALLRGAHTNNTLQVVFTPPLEYTAQRAAAYPYEVPATRNYNVWAEPSHRPFLRKAGSDFGWDWGPAFATSGIAGAVHVEWLRAGGSSATETEDAATEGERVRLADLHVAYAFPAPGDFSVARGRVTVDVLAVPHAAAANVTVRLRIGGQRHGDDVVVALPDRRHQDKGDHHDHGHSLLTTTEAALPFALPLPTLWWPAGSGAPHLYDVAVEAFVVEDTTPLAVATHRVGFRTVELVQEPTNAGGVAGGTFFFRVNGVPLFMKGANWIPNDSFPTRVTRAKVAFLLRSAVAAHMNMVRVWGGGRYESDFFYETCDALGLLVWHEYMFACALYPRDRAFLNEAAREVAFQTRRLRKHTCVAIWGGNNENENMMAGFAAAGGAAFNRDVAVTDFTKLFVDTVRPLVLALDYAASQDASTASSSARPFVDTSPSNGLISEDPYVKRWGADSNDVAFGDVHFYNYDGDCQDPQLYPRARFVSEFGFQSTPSLAGMQDVSAREDWTSFHEFWQLLKFRERHENGTQQMAAQLARRFHVPFPFRDEAWLATPLAGNFSLDVVGRVGAYLYLTQIQQALCYTTAIEAWRRGKSAALGGAGTMGVLYWQLNDVWQGTSWSSMEFDGRWKSLQYAVKRAYAPVLVSVVHEADEATGTLVVVGVNDLKDADLQVALTYDVVAASDGRVLRSVTSPSPSNAMATRALPRLSSELLDRVAVASLLAPPASCDAAQCFVRVRCTLAASPSSSTPPPPCDDAFVFLAPFKQLALRHGRVSIDRVERVERVEAAATAAFDVTLRADNFVALFVEVEAPPRVRGFWDTNAFHLVGNATQTLRFTVDEPADEQDEEDEKKRSASLSAEAFAAQLQVRWLQQTYETEATVAVA